mmetsp:Transcript_22809/g.73761  ORF Transcript_22809/g.73761 Transcript_22809/m.73761 type:complete len:241 (-) Transcript_22809:22-744(-)
MNELEAPDLDDVLLGVGLGLRRLEERVDVEAAAADADALDAEPRQGVVGRRAGGGARRRLVRAVVVERGRVKAARGVARAALVRARLALLVRDAQRRPEVQALGVALQVELHALDLEVVDVDGRRGAAAAAGRGRRRRGGELQGRARRAARRRRGGAHGRPRQAVPQDERQAQGEPAPQVPLQEAQGERGRPRAPLRGRGPRRGAQPPLHQAHALAPARRRARHPLPRQQGPQVLARGAR